MTYFTIIIITTKQQKEWKSMNLNYLLNVRKTNVLRPQDIDSIQLSWSWFDRVNCLLFLQDNKNDNNDDGIINNNNFIIVFGDWLSTIIAFWHNGRIGPSLRISGSFQTWSSYWEFAFKINSLILF